MLSTLQGAEMPGTKWRREQGFSEDFWQPLASASALCAFPWHVIPLLLWTSKGDAFPHRNWVHSNLSILGYWGPVHYLVKTVQVYESPKSCRIYALCSSHCSVPYSSEGINGCRLGRDGKREFLFSKHVNFNLFLWLEALFLVPFVFCAVPSEHIVLTQPVSMVVWLSLVGHYDFFQSCVGMCQGVRYLVVTLGHLAPASSFSWTDMVSETLCTWCHSLKCEHSIMYIEPHSNFGLCIWHAGTRSCFYKVVICCITNVTKTNSKVLVSEFL